VMRAKSSRGTAEDLGPVMVAARALDELGERVGEEGVEVALPSLAEVVLAAPQPGQRGFEVVALLGMADPGLDFGDLAAELLQLALPGAGAAQFVLELVPTTVFEPIDVPRHGPEGVS